MSDHTVQILEQSTFAGLQAGLRGELIQPGNEGYETAQKGAQPEHLTYRIGGYVTSVFTRLDKPIKRKSCFIFPRRARRTWSPTLTLLLFSDFSDTSKLSE